MADRGDRGCGGEAEEQLARAQDASLLESRSPGARPVTACRLPAIRRTLGILARPCALGVWAACQRRSSRRTHPGSRASASQMFSNENGQRTSGDSNQSAVSRKRRRRRTPAEPEHRQNVRIASSSTAAMSRSSCVRSTDRCRSSANWDEEARDHHRRRQHGMELTGYVTRPRPWWRCGARRRRRATAPQRDGSRSAATRADPSDRSIPTGRTR